VYVCCKVVDSVATLVAAIDNPAGASTLLLASSGSPYLLTGEILINRSVTIRPEDAEKSVTLDAQARTRIFRLLAGNATLSRLVLRNGRAHSAEPLDYDGELLSGVRGGVSAALSEPGP
jgi:hypothetical protein